MATPSAWDQHRVTDLVRDILRTAPRDDRYGSGRAFLTAYQIAIEFCARHQQIALVLAPAMGGAGDGPWALTTYLARWLPDRIERGANDIELSFLASQHLSVLEFDGGRRATTTQSGHESIMFRLRD